MKYLSLTCLLMLSVMFIHAQSSKLSPYVKNIVMTKGDMRHHVKSATNHRQPTLTAFVRTSDTDVLRREGCAIYAQWDDIVIASIPVSKIMPLAALPQVMRIEAGQSCFLTNDTTATITRTRDVWALSNNTPLTGKGVVVGVMDVGFDLTHPTFYSSDGSTYRIKQLWDQLDQSQQGETVTATVKGQDTIYVGRQYIGQEALLALQHSLDGVANYHGTHTSGTAAGSGWQGYPSPITSYTGMAPDADICLVSNATSDNADLIPEEEEYKYTTATDMLGFKYIFDYADKVGKPCVINFSEGAHDDLWESGIYSEVLSKMIGPGHIICASAGNEGYKNTYIHKAVGETGKGAFLGNGSSQNAIYVLRSQKPVQMRLSFYKDRQKALDKDYDLTTLADYPDSLMIDSIFIAADTMVVAMMTYPSCFDENLYATDLFLIDSNHTDCGYSIPTSLTILGEDNDIEAFGAGGYFYRKELDPTLADFQSTHNILFPGSAKDVICVGNAAYRTGFVNYQGQWRDPFQDGTTNGVISIYSSIGPALCGITKPDVVAPGMNIISSISSFYREANPTAYLYNEASQFTYNGRSYSWMATSGTSMSTPVTTGIIALWLQACPTLTPDQIREVFANSCTHYDPSLIYPNDTYGYGNIDALAGLQYIQHNWTGIEDIETNTQHPSPNTQHPSPNTQNLYTLDGRKVNNTTNLHGIFIITDSQGTRKIITNP